SSSNRLSSNRETNGLTSPPAATGGIQGIAPPLYCFRCPITARTPATRTIDSDSGLVGLCESCFEYFARAEVLPKGWVLPAERSLPDRPLPCATCRRNSAIRRADDAEGLPFGLCATCFSVLAEQEQVPINREGNTLPSHTISVAQVRQSSTAKGNCVDPTFDNSAISRRDDVARARSTTPESSNQFQ